MQEVKWLTRTQVRLLQANLVASRDTLKSVTHDVAAGMRLPIRTASWTDGAAQSEHLAALGRNGPSTPPGSRPAVWCVKTAPRDSQLGF